MHCSWLIHLSLILNHNDVRFQDDFRRITHIQTDGKKFAEMKVEFLSRGKSSLNSYEYVVHDISNTVYMDIHGIVVTYGPQHFGNL